MVAISLYRGHLHRVPPDVPHRWAMPPRTLSLSQFKLLTHRRSLALSRLLPPPPPPPCHVAPLEQQAMAAEVKGKEEEEGMGDSSGGCAKTRMNDASDVLKNEKEEGLGIDKDGDPDRENKRLKVEETLEAEVNKSHDSSDEKEEKKKELENKLHTLNEKKHHLVQLLKQILNAEEEIKRRSLQPSGFRPSIPSQGGETVVDVISMTTRPTPKLTIDVNCCNDTNAESDDASNNSQSRQFHFIHTSPSAASTATRGIPSPFQQNLPLHTSRGSPFATGHASSGMIMGSVAASPSRFAPIVQGHATSLSSISVPNAQFVASSPSPAALGGTSSVFRDSRLTNPS